MKYIQGYFLLVLCFLCGIVCKIYDDLHDSHFPMSDLFSDILKHLHTLLYTTITITDFNFATLFYLFNITNYLADSKAWSGSYEKSCLYVLLLPCLFSIGTQTRPKITDILFYIYFVLGCLLEVYLNFDEVSVFKLGFRIGSLLFCSTFLFVCSFFGIFSSFIYKIMIYMFGYVFASCVFQSIQLFKLYRTKVGCCPFLSSKHTSLDSFSLNENCIKLDEKQEKMKRRKQKKLRKQQQKQKQQTKETEQKQNID